LEGFQSISLWYQFEFKVVLKSSSLIGLQKQHGKDYKESKDGGREDIKRKKLFLATDAKIKKHNSQKNVTYQLGHNKFSDMANFSITFF
jgi:hypothetical protein